MAGTVVVSQTSSTQSDTEESIVIGSQEELIVAVPESQTHIYKDSVSVIVAATESNAIKSFFVDISVQIAYGFCQHYSFWE